MPEVIIVDYGMGNLYSVQQACRHVGLSAKVSASAKDLSQAPGAILPGVGAFGSAMAQLEAAGMPKALREFAVSGRPLLGICLGMQLLMEESSEFGRHKGLGLIEGDVAMLTIEKSNDQATKVPHIGWDALWDDRQAPWKGTFLEDQAPGAEMYFVHSFYVRPKNRTDCISYTKFGDQRFCSSLQKNNLWACQYHPERSGTEGLKIYRQFMKAVQLSSMESSR